VSYWLRNELSMRYGHLWC